MLTYSAFLYIKIVVVLTNMGSFSCVCVKNVLFITDNNIFYFVIMVRHGTRVIFTQMVSTHEAMVRGTLDFPNLISLNNITQDFVVDVEVYGMVGTLCVILVSETALLMHCLVYCVLFFRYIVTYFLWTPYLVSFFVLA